MEQLFANLPALIVALVFLVMWIAAVAAIVRTDQTTRAILFELQKVTAGMLLVHELVEAPKVKGKPRIMRAGEHQRTGTPLP